MVANRQAISTAVSKYLNDQGKPVRLNTIAAELRRKSDLGAVRDSEVRSVVQSMIVTGKLGYGPGLEIERK